MALRPIASEQITRNFARIDPGRIRQDARNIMTKLTRRHLLTGTTATLAATALGPLSAIAARELARSARC